MDGKLSTQNDYSWGRGEILAMAVVVVVVFEEDGGLLAGGNSR